MVLFDINRTAKTVTWIEQPNPKADPIDCKDAETGRFKWTIEGWRP